MEKSEIRAEAKKRLASILPEKKAQADVAIREGLYEVFGFSEADSVFIFMSTETEPETRDIIMECLLRGAKVYIPKLEGDEMAATEIYAGAEYVKNQFGIVEIKFAHPVKVDCAFNIVPLVAFDESLNRVGHGKGYYDKYLVGTTGVSVGLAYECQHFEGIKPQPSDIPLDIIVTESKTYFKNPT